MDLLQKPEPGPARISDDPSPPYTIEDLPTPVQPPAYQRVESLGPSRTATHGFETRLPVASAMIYEPTSRMMDCPVCEVTARSVMKREVGFRTHMAAAMLCMSIMCIPFMWTPYCMKDVKDANHYCGACGVLIGKEAPILPYRNEQD